jgi:hypothetical protein
MHKPTTKQIDKLIEAAYYRRCSGIQVDIMDIGKVFAAGRAAHAAWQDVETAIWDFVQTIRRN